MKKLFNKKRMNKKKKLIIYNYKNYWIKKMLKFKNYNKVWNIKEKFKD